MENPELATIETITLTQSAANAVRAVLDSKNLQGYALRLYVSGGGCSGYQYGLALDNRFRPEDTVFQTDDVKLIVDEVSIKYLQGATVDYVDNQTESGFTIINPNQISACSCGQTDASSDEQAMGGCTSCG